MVGEGGIILYIYKTISYRHFQKMPFPHVLECTLPDIFFLAAYIGQIVVQQRLNYDYSDTQLPFRFLRGAVEDHSECNLLDVHDNMIICGNKIVRLY